MNLKFSGKGLAFISHYMAKHDIRYYLNGVCLRPLPAEAGGGVLGIGTNGHVMGMWHDADGRVDRQVILRITPELVRACAKRPKGLTGDPTLSLVDGRLAITVDGAEVYIQPNEYRAPDPKGKPHTLEAWEIGGKYPDAGQVIPSIADAVSGPVDAVNREYLALIAKSLPHSKWMGVQMLQAHKGGAILVLPLEHSEAAVVLMPMRGEEIAAPTWLNRFRAHSHRLTAAQTAPLPVHEPSDAGPKDEDLRSWSLAKGGL